MSVTTTERPAASPPASCWVFDIDGMDCADCAQTIEAGVRRLPGIATATVNFGSATLNVTPEGGTLNPGIVAAAVARAGYRARLQGGTGAEMRRPWWRERRPREIAVAALLWFIGFLADRADAPERVSIVAFLLAMALAGYPVARAGWFALRARRADMNLLMTVAALGALPLGEWEEGASVLILFAIGLLLQTRTLERTRRAVQDLMRLTPDEAVVRRDGVEQRVAVGAVQPGDLVVIRPGERVPVDGTVRLGSSAVDQSPITGESVPVEVESGSEVFAGAINGGGLLDIEATRPASASTLARVIRLIEEAQASRAPAQAFVDRFAAVYTPVVVGLALLLALGGSVATGDVRHWVMLALVLLVVACPCALVISTPVALVAAIGAAARRGVLFKGGSALEALAAVRTVAFDKTGTLTHGRPVVREVIPLDGLPADEILARAAAVERGAVHPIARGILAAAGERGLSIPASESSISRAGFGARAVVDGVDVSVGSTRLFPVQSDATRAAVDRLDEQGIAPVLVGDGGTVRGVIALADPVRPTSAATVAALGRLGIETVMLTGDRRAVSARIGREVGVETIHAGLLPDEKLAAVETLKTRGRVAMVGDGINDAPALAAASVGVAMGLGGSDVALEAAGVVLAGDDLAQLPGAIGLARATMRVIRENIAVSLVVKALFLALTVAGVTNLWLAVVADMGTSLLVTGNSLRLMRRASPQKTT